MVAYDGSLLSVERFVKALADAETPLHPTTTYARSTMPVSCRGKRASNGKLYGRNITTDMWSTSTDSGANWTSSGIAVTNNPVTAGSVLEVVFHSTFMVAVTDNAELHRATIDDFDSWTDISAPGVPAGTTGRQGVLASNGSVLLYGNYNASVGEGAYVWRSTDDGANWTEVMTVAAARHVHAVAFESDGKTAWATVGDDIAASGGLYRSVDAGVTWTRVSATRYGIDIAFAPSFEGIPSRVILEGDGTAEAHLFAFREEGNPDAVTDPLVWYDDDPADAGASWAGSTRALVYTSEKNLIFATTGEGGAIGTRYGLWIAKGPWYNNVRLLEEFTEAASPAWLKSFESGGYVLNGIQRITKPIFRDQS